MYIYDVCMYVCLSLKVQVNHGKRCHDDPRCQYINVDSYHVLIDSIFTH